MEFDFKAMQQKMSQELANTKSYSENSEGTGLPLVYLGQNGKMVTKLFYNPKMGGLQRKITRHPIDAEGKAKVPCLKEMYGEDCPICETIKNIKQAKGDDCGVGKYAYKARGICYAQLIDFDPVYCSEQNDPNKGDTVMLMYPVTLYNKVNQLMVDAGDNVGKLIASNSGFATIFSRSQTGKKYEYNVTLDALRGEVKSYDTADQYEDALSNLPNLNDAFVPSMPNDEIRNKVKAASEAIMQEFLGSAIVNPGDSAKEVTAPPPEFDNDDELPFEIEDEDEVVAKTVEATSTIEANGNKPCFGKHKDGDANCMNCPMECDCIVSGIE